MPDYYQILEVDRDAASNEFNEILNKAYKNIKPEVDRELAKQAFTILNDPQQRRKYDKLLKEKGHEVAVIELQKMPKKLYLSKTLSQLITPIKSQSKSASQSNLNLIPQVLEMTSIPSQLSLLNQLEKQSFSKLSENLGVGKTTISKWLSPSKAQYTKHENYSKIVSLIEVVNTRKKLTIMEHHRYDEASKIQCILNLLIDLNSNFEEVIKSLNPQVLNPILLNIIRHNKIYSEFNSTNYTRIIVSILKQLNINNKEIYSSNAPLFESYRKNTLFILGLVYCDSTTRFAIMLRHFSGYSYTDLQKLIQAIKEHLGQIDYIDTDDLYSDLDLLLNFNKGMGEDWINSFNYLSPINQQALKLPLWILNCNEINRIDQFNLQFSTVNGGNNIAVLLNYLNLEKSELSKLSKFNSNFSLDNISKVIQELLIINKPEIYIQRFSELSLPFQKQFCLSLIYSLHANNTKYEISLRFQKDITDLTELQTVMETHLQDYLDHPKYKTHCDTLKEIILKQKRVLEQNVHQQNPTANQHQSQQQTNMLRTKNIEKITTALSMYISWMNQNTNTSFIYRLLWGGHIFHGKTGKVRAKTALDQIKKLEPNSEQTYQQVKEIVRQTYNSSGNCKHSLRRFLFAALNNDVTKGFERSQTVRLSDAAFKKQDQQNDILSKLNL